MIKIIEAKNIGNYYGSLNIKQEDGKFYWGIENYSGTRFEEIPEDLFVEIKEFVESND